MSQPAALTGAAYSRTAAVVAAADGDSVSISGTSLGHATAVTRTPASSAATSCSYLPASTVPAVASRPTRRFRVACTAACASGVITPRTGTARLAWSSGRAAEVAVLQATTTIFTPSPSR